MVAPRRRHRVGIASTGDGIYFADEPSVSVSWAPQTRGEVWVANMLFDPGTNCGGGVSSCPPKLEVHKFNSATNSFQRKYVFTGLSSEPHSPVIMTHTSNAGWIFVAWLNQFHYDATSNQYRGQINVACSFDDGVTWETYTKTVGRVLDRFSDSLAHT